MNATRLLAAACGALLLAAVPATAQTTLDNLTCFRVKDRTPHTKFTATLGANVGGQTCTFRAPAQLACVDTHDTRVNGPANGGTAAVANSFLCYPAKCRKPAPGAATFTDAFGSRLITFRTAQLFCVPASGTPGAVSTTTTVPGGVTTTTVAAGCRFTNGECRGSCPGGGTCGAAVGTASCECRSTSCGDADAPECNGACSSPNEACTFSLTGCSCVRIP